MQTETATLGGGCFWCLEAAFAALRGVDRVVSGYAGGHVPNPTYEQVCGMGTGHAEAVQVTYDPTAITFRDLLDVFFTVHDPTTLDRQGADVGPQYRSIVLAHTKAQENMVTEVIGELDAQGVWERPIVTEVQPFEAFYPADDYHQEYYARNNRQPYCRAVISPKLAKLRERHRDLLRAV